MVGQRAVVFDLLLDALDDILVERCREDVHELGDGGDVGRWVDLVDEPLKASWSILSTFLSHANEEVVLTVETRYESTIDVGVGRDGDVVCRPKGVVVLELAERDVQDIIQLWC